LNANFDFTYTDVLSQLGEELKYIQSNVTWLSGLLTSYSHNSTSKLGMSKIVTTATMAAMEQTVDSVLSKIRTHALSLLQSKSSDSQTNMKVWYHTAYTSMQDLAVYFDNSYLEEQIRKSYMWRQPVAELATLNLLRYTYQDTETWRTWSRSVSLEMLIGSGYDISMVTDMVGAYTSTLYEEMYAIELQLTNAKREIMAEYGLVVRKLNEFQQKSVIADDFILQNFLKMDVYFSALKFESVEQLKSYGVLNFLSEVGGYLGLLIGASAITLVEITDVFVYNFCLKASAWWHRRKAVTSVNVKAANAPVDNTRKHGAAFSAFA